MKKYLSQRIIFFLFFIAPSILSTQSLGQSVDMEFFKGHESWPIYNPSTSKLKNHDPINFRITMDIVFPTRSGDTLMQIMYINAMEVIFRNKHANWIEWIANSKKLQDDGANLDLFIMDRTNGSLMLRMYQSDPQDSWGGPYNSYGVEDKKIRRVTFKDNSVTNEEYAKNVEDFEIDAPIYDVGTLGFVLPFMEPSELSKGVRLRLLDQYSDTTAVRMSAAKLIGETNVVDARGKTHKVMEVQVLDEAKAGISTYYVSDKAPYFYGWEYKNKKTGRLLWKSSYRGHTRYEDF